MIQNYINSNKNTIYSNNGAKEIAELSNGMDLLKKKILKKKEKSQSIHLNFTNPYNKYTPAAKINLETSIQNGTSKT